MTELEFTQLKNKIKDKELQSATAKGKQDSILELWKTKYGCSSLEEAKVKLEEIKKENAEKEKKRDEYFEKLKAESLHLGHLKYEQKDAALKKYYDYNGTSKGIYF
jgi:hypothetical protein